ncbi:MAG: ArsC family (seleno)protein [Vicinamibacteria bacterium]
MTCKKTQEFLAKTKTETRTVVSATKTHLVLKDAKELLKGVDEIYASKGSRVDRLVMKDKPSDAELERALMGPTGRLRAPTARIGRRLLVGFNEATYRATLS